MHSYIEWPTYPNPDRTSADEDVIHAFQVPNNAEEHDVLVSAWSNVPEDRLVFTSRPLGVIVNQIDHALFAYGGDWIVFDNHNNIKVVQDAEFRDNHVRIVLARLGGTDYWPTPEMHEQYRRSLEDAENMADFVAAHSKGALA